MPPLYFSFYLQTYSGRYVCANNILNQHKAVISLSLISCFAHSHILSFSVCPPLSHFVPSVLSIISSHSPPSLYLYLSLTLSLSLFLSLSASFTSRFQFSLLPPLFHSYLIITLTVIGLFGLKGRHILRLPWNNKKQSTGFSYYAFIASYR